MIDIKRYIYGQRKGNLNLGRTSFSHEKNIGIVPRYIVMCGRLKIKKEYPILKWKVIKNAVNIGLATTIACFAMRS